MKHETVTINLSKALPLAWRIQWEAALKRAGRGRRSDYVTASDVENQVRVFAAEQLEGKAWGSGEPAWGRPWYGVRVSTGERYGLKYHVREWLLDQVRSGVLESHNFGRGHISGMRFRAAGHGMNEAEKETVERRKKPWSEKPVHARHGSSRSLLCTANRNRGYSTWRRGRYSRVTDKPNEVTCPRCAKLMRAQQGDQHDAK